MSHQHDRLDTVAGGADPLAFPNLAGTKLSDRVAHELQLRILRGDLEPGDRLPTEAELGARLGVSRSVVRDAVRTLVARGLVTVRQGHGMEVTSPSATALGEALILVLMRSGLSLREIMEARAAIETRISPLAAARGSDADWAALRARLDGFEQAVEAGNWSDAHDEHLRFHLALLDAVHLPALAVILRPMHELIVLSSLPPHLDDGAAWDVSSHHDILAKLMAGDVDQVETALREHFAFIDDPAYSARLEMPFRDVPTIQELFEQPG